MALPPFEPTKSAHKKFMKRVDQWEKAVDDAIIREQVLGKRGDVQVTHGDNVGLGRPNAATMAVLRDRFVKAGWRDLHLDEPPSRPNDPIMTLFRHY